MRTDGDTGVSLSEAHAMSTTYTGIPTSSTGTLETIPKNVLRSRPPRLSPSGFTPTATIPAQCLMKTLTSARSPATPMTTMTSSIEYCILPLLLWSDATHLSSFGSAALWPIYLYFGNLSKYVRGRPTEFAAQRLAYIPEVSWVVGLKGLQSLFADSYQLPDSVKDKYAELLGKSMNPEVMKFLRRDLYQHIWSLLLDDEFMNAYKHGIVIKCADGIVRRLFPRIFTYSADYPEKYVVSLSC